MVNLGQVRPRKLRMEQAYLLISDRHTGSGQFGVCYLSQLFKGHHRNALPACKPALDSVLLRADIDHPATTLCPHQRQHRILQAHSANQHFIDKIFGVADVHRL